MIGSGMINDKNLTLIAKFNFLFERAGQWVMRAFDKKPPHWYFFIYSCFLKSLDNSGICFMWPLDIEPRSSYDQLPLIQLRYIIPVTQSDRYSCPTERFHNETLNFKITLYQRRFIHDKTPSFPATAKYMSLPFSPEEVYLLFTSQFLTTRQFPTSAVSFCI